MDEAKDDDVYRERRAYIAEEKTNPDAAVTRGKKNKN